MLVLVSLCVALAEPLPVLPAQVEIAQPRAEWLGSPAPPRLKMHVQVTNRLPFALRTLRLGVLYAASPEALRGHDPGALYKKGAPGVSALQQEIDASVPAQASAEVTLLAAVPGASAPPSTYVAHVLGYTLADVDTTTLLRLLGGTAAADEVAACATLAVTGNAEAKHAARQRFAANAPLAQGLLDIVNAPAPPKPSQAETFRRVFALRALGVLGTEAAAAALRTLASTDLGTWDEALQVLHIARITGTPWETPLAYALPDHGRRMSDVVNAALDDAVALPPALAELDQNVTVAEADAALPAPPPKEQPPSWRWWALVAALAAAAGVWQRLRRRDGAR